eukprot:CAMPEP_0196219844 /NCGR_PEP_ID=MMETSP0912-20130531/39579_1 /TAXON_ID=49265 /ORGANISM="Thalassiosira rotula, Strain GSO102" /LENGTH=128 /DNA_ID=CAMNT_0041497931 /DNA_START=500 /DNA_END=883 /DNA_ORIENTATION=+
MRAAYGLPFPDPTSATPSFWSVIGKPTLTTFPQRAITRNLRVRQSLACYTPPTSPAIAFSTAGLPRLDYHPAAHPIFSPVNAIITFSPHLPIALPFPSAPVVATTTPSLGGVDLITTITFPVTNNIIS